MAEQNPKQQQQQINIELGEKEAEGAYSNLAIISHFTRVLPGVPKARVHSRIIMTPQHVKMFLGALKENIERFENQFGEIKIANQMTENPFGFQLPQNKGEKIN